MAKVDKVDEISPYKDMEFNQFIKIIKNGQVAHWKAIAEQLGVDQNTITKWKKTTEAQTAIVDGITKAVRQMETAGKKDWRMWESKLKMLGVNPATNVDVTSDGEKLSVALVEFVNSDGNSKDSSQVS